MRFTTLAFAACAVLLPRTTSAQERPSDPLAAARTELAKAGYTSEDLQDVVLKDQYRTARTGAQHTFYRQRWQGIEVWNGDVAIHQAVDGRIVKLNNGTFSHLAKRVDTTSPALSPEAALALVLNKDGVKGSLPMLTGTDASLKRWSYDGAAFSGEPVTVQLVYQPVNDRLQLAWNVNYYSANGIHWWNVRVDATTGAELDRNDWVSQCGFDAPHAEHAHGAAPVPEEAPAPAPAAPNDYRVYPWPAESPNHGAHVIRNAPWTAGGIASPYGWHDTNGAAGAEYTITRGNNVWASEDANADNVAGVSPDGGATLDFDFAVDLAQAPSAYLSAATTNLFYWNNLMHDVWYQYGFDDPAGNFQSNNYGRGGAGNDWVNADAQDGSGTSNANFGTPPDGSNPRMQMYRWTNTTPNRDSDLDNGVIAHEYGHGISNRLVGGPSNTSCLGNAEQMGEGWSDYFGLMMTIEAGDQRTDVRGIGTYLLGQPVSGGGIRPAPYCTNFATNSYTYANTNSGVSQPHGIGFVWCTMLWELTWDLVDQYGLDPDIYNGTGGNNIAMQLVIDGLKLTACNPGFVDARDAILQADVLNNGGANQNLIWSAFARRGLGVSASQGSSSSRSDQTEAFDTPMPNNIGVSALVAPAPGLLFDCAASGIAVQATVRNYGQATQTGFPVRYSLDGGPLVSETFTGSLPAGAAVNFTFSTPLTITGGGAHTLIVSTALAGDGATSNDALSSSISITNTLTSTVPFAETVDAGLVTPTGWFLQNPDNGTTWTTTALTNGPACASTTSWSINNFSYNAPGQVDRLLSPVIDLSTSGSTRLKFDHAYAEYSSAYVDGFRVEVSNDCGVTWNQVFFAQGAALATAPATTSNYTPSACSQWQAHDLDISAYDGQDILVRFTAINGFGNWLYLDNVQVVSNGLPMQVKLMLEGPYDAGLGRMRDDLRAASLIPTTEPFTALGFTQVGGGGGETVLPAVFSVTGDDAIVDWVLVELRSAVTPSTIVATRSALVQRDGDVVGTNGTSPVLFNSPAGSYYVAVRHRNHLACMTATPLALTGAATSVDLTLAGTATYGTGARKDLGGIQGLWTGNVTLDTELLYTGAGNDRDPILQAIGGVVPTNSITGYRMEDTNLDGVVKYTGTGNDRDVILFNIGGTVPTNNRVQQLP
ncbi:MAG: M36 family metallopeptidase [Flavobacteriales bacterium]|nr:M36 family metallopeptidase [Flavobacteriales bacterium]